MKYVRTTLLMMLTAALVLSCSQTLEFTARGPVTFRNYSTKAITEVSAFWEGIPGGKAIVLKLQNGTKVSVAAGSVETPAVASIEAAHYFPNAYDVTYTAKFSDNTTEALTTTDKVINFAKPVAEVFESTISLKNEKNFTILEVYLHRSQTSEPTKEYSKMFLPLTGLPLTGIKSGSTWPLSLSSTSSTSVSGTFHVYVGEYREGVKPVYVGSVTISNGSASIIAK